MSESERNTYNIPDDYLRDSKLTNWMRKHMGMQELRSVYINDYDKRSHLTKKGFSGDCVELICVLDKRTVRMQVSEWMSIEANWR